MAYSLSYNVRKMDSAGRHNDRNFNVDKANHIDKDRMQQNLYWNYQQDKERTFKEIELDFYKENFQKTIDLQNEKNNEARHPERNKTIEDYYTEKRTRPEDVLIQLGTKEKHIESQKLWEVANTYREEFEKKYGEHCKVLTMALHNDEQTPHVHMRRVWIAEEEGISKASKRMALDQLQISRENLEQERNKNNNEQKMFLQMEREMVRKICEEKHIELKQEHPSRGIDIPSNEYKEILEQVNKEIEQQQEHLKELEKEAREKEQLIERTKEMIQRANDALENTLKEINEDKYKQIQNEKYKDEFDRNEKLLSAFNKDDVERVEELEIKLEE